MTWLLLTALAVLSRAIYGVFGKVMSNRVPVSAAAQSLTLQVVCIPLTLLASPAPGGLSTRGIAEHWPVISLMALSIGVGNILYFEGMKRLGAGLTQIAFSSIILWGAGLSVAFLDSSFNGLQIAGALTLMIAIGIAQYDGKKRINSGIFFIVLSAACFAGFQVTSAGLSDALTGGTYLVLSYACPAVFTFLVVLPHIGRECRALRGNVRSSLAATFPAAVTTVAYYAFAFFAYRRAPDAGVVVVLLTTQTIVAVLLAMIFLKERHNVKRTAIAAVLALAAAIAIRA